MYNIRYIHTYTVLHVCVCEKFIVRKDCTIYMHVIGRDRANNIYIYNILYPST